MNTIKAKKKYFTASVIMIVVAIFCDMTAKGYYSKSTREQALYLKSQDNTKENNLVVEGTIKNLISKGNVWSSTGMVMAILSVITYIISEIKKEKTKRLTIIGLIMCYLLTLFIMV